MTDVIASLAIEFRALTGKLTSELQGVTGAIQNTERKINAVMGGIQKTMHAALVIGGVIAVKKLADSLNELAEAGEVADDIATGFQKLGGSAAQIDLAKEKLLGMVDAFDLMRIANEGLVKNIPGFNDNFAQIADLGGRLADTLGTDTKGAIEQVTQALATGKERGLEMLGFVIDSDKAYQDYAKSVGLAANQLSDAAKKEAVQIQAMNQLLEVTERLAPVTDSVATAHTAAQRAIGEAYKEIGIAINKSEGLRKAWRELEQAIDDVDWNQVGQDVADVFSVIIEMSGKATTAMARWLRETVIGFKVLGSLQEELKNQWSVPGLAANFVQGKPLFDFGNVWEEAVKKVGDQYANRAASQAMHTLGEDLQDLEKKLISAKSLKDLDRIKPALDELGEAAKKKGNVEVQAIAEGLFKQFEKLKGVLPETAKLIGKYGDESEDALKRQQEAAEKAAEEIVKLRENIDRELRDIEIDSLKDGLEASIKNLDQTSFNELKTKLHKNVYDGVLAGYKEALEKDPASEAKVRDIAQKRADLEIERWLKDQTEANTKHAEDLAEKEKEAHEEAIDFWQSEFRKALDGEFTDLDDLWKDALASFAAQFAAAIDKGWAEGMKDAGSIGAMVGNLIGQGVTGSLGKGGNAPSGIGGSGGFWNAISSAFGFGSSTALTTDLAHQQGIQGPGLASGEFGSSGGEQGWGGFVQAGLGILTSAISAAGIDRESQSGAGTGRAAGGAIGAGIGLIGGPPGSAIGQGIGSIAGGLLGGLFKWGPQNPETQARHAFSNFVEEGFKKLKTVAFYDIESGRLKLFEGDKLNFLEGASTRFNNGAWVEQAFGGMSAQTATVFQGLGEGFRGLLDIAEDVGGQIGALLAENLGGNLNNARLLVYQLGISFEEVEEKLVQAGLSGEKRWHEVEVAIQGAARAFEPGLEAVGDLTGAVEELAGSGGRGMVAIKAVKDIAVEALEAGAKTIADLPRVMAEKGVSQETIDAIMNAIKQRGIKTLEELAAVSDRVGGGIVADIESSSKAMADHWKEMEENLDSVTQKLEALPEEINSSINIKVKAIYEDGAKEAIDAVNSGGANIDIPGVSSFALGGVVSSRSLFGRNVIGESGMEGILPLKTMPNGRLGVSADFAGGNPKGMTIVVNAPNATPGMEHRITQAIEEMGEVAVARAVEAVYAFERRGL